MCYWKLIVSRTLSDLSIVFLRIKKKGHLAPAVIVLLRRQSCCQVSLKAPIIILRVKTFGLSVHEQKDQLRLTLNPVA